MNQSKTADLANLKFQVLILNFVFFYRIKCVFFFRGVHTITESYSKEAPVWLVHELRRPKCTPFMEVKIAAKDVYFCAAVFQLLKSRDQPNFP